MTRDAQKFANSAQNVVHNCSRVTPDLVFIKAGTLDHSEDLRPTREIWTEMAVPWSKIPDGLDKFPRSSTWGSSQPGIYCDYSLTWYHGSQQELTKLRIGKFYHTE